MKHIKITMAAAVALAGLTACDKDYDVTIPTPEIPFDAEMEAALSKYDVLTEYSSRAGVPFGVSVTPEDLAAKKLAFSIVTTNYSQVEAPGAFTPSLLMNDEGTYDYSALSTLITAAGEAGVSVFGPALCSLSNLPVDYLNAQIAPIIIPYEPVEPETGDFIFNDFEGDELGKTYPMSGNSVARVVEDPDGQSGHVLHIGEDGNTANQSFPEFEVTMPEGKTLANLTKVCFDIKAPGSGGLYGSGLRLFVEGVQFSFGNCTTFGCSDNKWGRDLVKLTFEPAQMSAADLEKTTFKMRIGSATGSGNYYIDNIKILWEVAGDDDGKDNVLDFENDALGKSYPMTGNSFAVVANDPEGKSGKVLQVGSQADPSNHSYVKVTVKLPEGRKLGDYEAFQCDMKTVSGQYGWGGKVLIGDRQIGVGSPADFSANDGGPWVRGGIYISFVDSSNAKRYIELTDEEKAMTEFIFSYNADSGAGIFYLDNFTFKRVISTEDTVIEKTPEEKTEIMQGELDKWIDGLVATTGESVTDMIIYDEPFDDEVASFNWADYLGDDYVAKAQAKVDAAATAPVRYFVSQTLVMNDNTAGDIADLATEISKLEQKGVKVDAVNLVLSATYSEDYVTQQKNDETAVAAMEALASLGKPVRISNFAVRVVNRGNMLVNPSTIGISERRAIGEYYATVIKAYKQALGDQALGFNLSRVVEDGTFVAPWAAGGNRNYIYEGLVNGLSK
ncbi:MAG: endo-1,4-beta-xylanase [Paenibacillus sp.]|nr:endo-1,4-beta-xylanase [Paenibacillus sp.]